MQKICILLLLQISLFHRLGLKLWLSMHMHAWHDRFWIYINFEFLNETNFLIPMNFVVLQDAAAHLYDWTPKQSFWQVTKNFTTQTGLNLGEADELDFSLVSTGGEADDQFMINGRQCHHFWFIIGIFRGLLIFYFLKLIFKMCTM